MKALSLWQPWASLVALGKKQIETRSWSTAHRGLLAIHATQAYPDEAKALVWTEPFYSALNQKIDKDHSIMPPLPRGAIVAVCELLACVQVHEEPRVTNVPGYPDPTGFWIPPDEPERSFGDYMPGRYAWMLKNIRKLKIPVLCSGHQQLWEVPAALVEQIEEQLK